MSSYKALQYTCQFSSEFPMMAKNHRELHLDYDNNHPYNIAEYVKSLVGIHFNGQTSTDEDTDCTTLDNESLGTVMKEMEQFLRNAYPERIRTGEQWDKIIEFIVKLAKYRKKKGEEEENCFDRLMADCRRFLNIYQQQEEIATELLEEHYWGTRQQLIAGKVIADRVDTENGTLDPVFGALLTPTVGRVGPGNSSFLHRMLFDNDGEFSYHSAVHDAFGFLNKFYKIGPGYDYLDLRILGRRNMFAGQLTGLYFWWKVLSKAKKSDFIL